MTDDERILGDPDWDVWLASTEATDADGISNDESRIDGWLETIRTKQAELVRNHETARIRIARIEDWEAGEGAKIERRLSHLRSLIGTLAPTAEQMQKEFGKKSRDLPNGTFGWKKDPDKIEVTDEDHILAKHPQFTRVTTKTAVATSVIMAWAKASGETEGEGWRKVPGGDEFYVKAAK